MKKDTFASPHGTIHVNQPLTNLSLKYPQGEFIAEEVLPRMSVAKDTDLYFVFGRQDQDVTNDLVANGSGAAQVAPWKIDATPTYNCKKRALKDNLTDTDRRNADTAVDPESTTTLNLTERIMLNREIRVSGLVTNYANYAASGNRVTLSGAQQWDNVAYDPVTTPANAIERRVSVGKEAIRRNIGMKPNHIIIPAAVAETVKQDAKIRDLIKYTQSDLLVNGDLPPTLWGMKVLIPGSIRNSANPGQTFSAADVWGKHVVMFYKSTIPALRTMSFGFSPESVGRKAYSWRDPDVSAEQEWFAVQENIDEIIASYFCAYIIKDTIT